MAISPSYFKCPLCSQYKMRKHCETKTCHWALCTNKDCQATLAPTAKIGNVLLPKSEQYRDKSGNLVTLRRLLFADGKWVTRPDGPEGAVA